MGNEYVPITRVLYEEHLGDTKRQRYLCKEDLSKKLKQVVELIAKENGELFPSDAQIVTSQLSQRRVKALERLARGHGYSVRCEDRDQRMRYLYSDGYGHNPKDFYEIFVYTKIYVTLLTSKKGERHAHS